MEPLQLDPRAKQQIKNALYMYLYEPVEKHFAQRLTTLIVKNSLLGQHAHNSFMYKGVLYNCDGTPPPRKSNKLLPQLVPYMDAYLKDLKTLNDTEIPYVLGFINQVLNSSNALSDYLRLLPESVHEPIEKMIKSWPCRAKELPQETVNEIQQFNQRSISLMKQRMLRNLLM